VEEEQSEETREELNNISVRESGQRNLAKSSTLQQKMQGSQRYLTKSPTFQQKMLGGQRKLKKSRTTPSEQSSRTRTTLRLQNGSAGLSIRTSNKWWSKCTKALLPVTQNLLWQTPAK